MNSWWVWWSRLLLGNHGFRTPAADVVAYRDSLDATLTFLIILQA